jgi:hypothetical protein
MTRAPAMPVLSGHVLAALIAVSCALSVRAEYFVVVLAVLSLVAVARSEPGTVRRAWSSIDRSVLRWAVVLLVLWCYGFVLGMAQGHPPGHVVRNFFGLGFFLPALLGAALIGSRAGIARLVVASGGAALALLLGLRLTSIFGVVSLEAFQWLGVPVGLSDFGFRLYSFGMFPIFGWQAVTAQSLHHSLRAGALTRAGWRAAQLLLIVSAAAFVTESKGMLLGSLAVLGVPLLLRRGLADHGRYAVVATAVVALHLQVVTPVAAHVAARWLGLQRSVVLANVVKEANAAALPTTPALGDEAPIGLVDTIFGAQRLGNVERYAQARELLNDLEFFGRGLGAPISSGFSRSASYPYGFELSYLNVVHKLGALSTIYLGFLLFTVYRIVRSPVPIQERSAALGLLGYLFPAIGNPILFAVQAVFLHALALHAVTRRRPAAGSSPQRRAA